MDDRDRDHCPRCGEAWRKRALLAEEDTERLRRSIERLREAVYACLIRQPPLDSDLLGLLQSTETSSHE